jgi:hypothetical protein
MYPFAYSGLNTWRLLQAAAVFPVLYLFHRMRKRGAKREIMAMVASTAEIGRVKKIAMLPCEMVSDWRSDISTIGPRTSARTIGAGG